MATNQGNDQLLTGKLTEIVLANLKDENFGIDELSNASGLNPRKIRQILKSSSGKTISQFIREIRLRKAFEMLENEDITASEVAFKTGFGSPTYFNTCFHEFFGFPPGEVRKRRSHEITNDLIKNPEGHGSGSLKQSGKYVITLKNKSVIYTALSVIAAVIVLGSYIILTRKFTTVGKKEISIAVLPFKNLSTNKEDQYFIDGIMEEILTNLSRIGELRVVSRTSVEQFRETILQASAIGKKLDVDYLVEGSGQKYGSRISLRVQLISVHNERHVWAESYEREIRETEDIINIQSEVAQTIASQLNISIKPLEKQAMEKIPTTNLTAYDYYLKGFNECYRNHRYDRGEILFKKALALDSTFSFAYSGLFIVYKFRHYYSSYYTGNYQDSLLILANKSLEFDRNYWPGYLGRGEYYSLTGRTEEAINECNKSLEINPDYWVTYICLADIYLWNNYYADYLKSTGYFKKAAEVERGDQLPETLYKLGNVYGNFAGFPDKAKEYFRDASDLQNDTLKFLNTMAYYEMVNGNFDKAVELAVKSYSNETNNREALRVLGLSFLFKRDYRESLNYFRKFAEILKESGEFQTSSMIPIGYAFYQNGLKEEADKWFDEQKRFSEVSLKYGRWYSAWGFADLDLGIMYSLTGRKEEAYKYLRKFAHVRVCPLFLITDMKYSPIYDSLRDDSEFQILFKNLEAKYHAEHERVRKSLINDK